MSTEKITVLMVKPGRLPEKTRLSTAYSSLVKAVNEGGGHCFKPETMPIDNHICLIYNSRLAWSGLEPNRKVSDIIFSGNLCITGLDEQSSFRSLTDEELQQYTMLFANIERFEPDEVLNNNLTYKYTLQKGGNGHETNLPLG